MTNSRSSFTKPAAVGFRLLRAALLVLGMGNLVTGIWGGLLRVPLTLPLPVEHANWISFHGPLVVCGFLGTVISLERAVGFGRLWTYLVPSLAGGSSVAIAFGSLASWPRWTLFTGSIVFVGVIICIVRIQPALPNFVMGFGALAWAAGNLQWACNRDVSQIVLWWITFLLLVITGERIELPRFQRPSRLGRAWLLSTLTLLGLGLATTQWLDRAGCAMVGVALIAVAAWLLRFDLGWCTIRNPGLPRFMAVCLISGFFWLLIAGAIIGSTWPQSAGFAYDASLHAFFLGFIFSMIFRHAPVIFPSVLGIQMQFRSFSYLPLIVLHASVVMRILGDTNIWPQARMWGAAGNGVAIGLFLLGTALSTIGVPRRPGRKATIDVISPRSYPPLCWGRKRMLI